MRNRLLALASALVVAGTSVPAAAREEADALSYGAYLSARIAADEHDAANAAKFYRQSLERDPTDASLLALAFFSLLFALNHLNLSLVAPASASLTLVTNAIAGKFFLHENVDRRRWTAAVLVCVGVYLLAH